MTAPTVVVDRAAIEAVLYPARHSHAEYSAAVAHLGARLEHPAVPVAGMPVVAWRALAAPISWWEQIDTSPATTEASRAATDRTQAELRELYARNDVDITAPAPLYTALMVVAYLRIRARMDAQLGRITTDEAAAVLDATNPVGVALTRWVPQEARR